MDQLTSLGLILLLALVAGHLVRVLRVPEVTGYILVGMVLGPSMLGWLDHNTLVAFGVLAEVALGLILFSVGSVFEFFLFRRIGRQLATLTLIESALASGTVFAGMLIFGQPFAVALLLGALAIETAPASTLMVVREVDSAGPLTDSLLGIIAINNLLCLTVYSIVAAGIEFGGAVETSGVLLTLYRSGFSLVWQLVGSVALGFLVGLLLAGWSQRVTEGGEMLILLAGSLLLCVGVSRALDLSALVASLSVGATMVNLTRRSRSVFDTLAGTDPPFYAIFFVIAGAELDLALVPTMGVLGLVYLLGRGGGKFIGARYGARRVDLPLPVQRYLGFTLVAQAGLAIGLTFAIRDRFPEYGPIVTTVVLASVAIYEIIGPVSTRYALVQAGEAGRARPPVDPLLASGLPVD